MNQIPSPQCPQCGRNLSTDDLRGTNCPSCGTALPHHARAAQQVALVNQVLAQHMAAPPPYAQPPHVFYVTPHAVQQATRASSYAVKIAIAIAALLILLVIGAAIAAIVLVRSP